MTMHEDTGHGIDSLIRSLSVREVQLSEIVAPGSKEQEMTNTIA